jgi:hypothetical protein
MDPQTVKLPSADPLSADALAKFREQTTAYLVDLSAPQVGQARVAQASSPATPAAASKSALPPGFSVAGMAQYVGEPRGAVN